MLDYVDASDVDATYECVQKQFELDNFTTTIITMTYLGVILINFTVTGDIVGAKPMKGNFCFTYLQIFLDCTKIHGCLYYLVVIRDFLRIHCNIKE